MTRENSVRIEAPSARRFACVVILHELIQVIYQAFRRVVNLYFNHMIIFWLSIQDKADHKKYVLRQNESLFV